MSKEIKKYTRDEMQCPHCRAHIILPATTYAVGYATDPRDAEIERLKSRAQHGDACLARLATRAEAAEAEIERLKVELEDCESWRKHWSCRAFGAEAEVERLWEALEQVSNDVACCGEFTGDVDELLYPPPPEEPK